MHSLYQESGSYQDSSNGYANRLDTDTDTDMDMNMGICIYTGLGPSRSVNQQVFQASKVTPYVKSRGREAWFYYLEAIKAKYIR